MVENESPHVMPFTGKIENPRVTGSVNPCSGATVIVEVPMAVALTVRLVGLAVRVKS
jgi:hypothetical protein